jgi:hypothetical protein
MSRTNKIAVAIIIAILITIGAVWTINYMSTRQVTINFSNVSKLGIYNKDNKLINEVSKSGQNLRLSPGKYMANFTATKDYSSGSQNFNVSGNTTVEINPAYSEEKLQELLKSQLGEIHSVLSASLSGINQYIIQPGTLYSHGDWYGTVLTYNGDDPYSADSVRVVMHKANGSWKLVNNLPDIVVSKAIYPQIPDDILDKVNHLPSIIQAKYFD